MSIIGYKLAQDAAQNAFIQAYRELSSLRKAAAFPGWFRRIIYTQCAMLTRRKHMPTTPLEAFVEVPSPLPGPDEAAERSELTRQVQEAVRELPEAQRVVTTLFYINGYSHQEIADFLEVPAKTVKSRLHASRGRLRERMIDMMEDELKANALPEDFTEETIEQAVARAGELNKGRQFDQAEELLRKVLERVPEHPGALKELNHALAKGRVYGEGKFEILPELAEYGRTILHKVDDEWIRDQFAGTLLAIPAMPEAVAFIEEWIMRKGGNLEKLGMLAYAKGCVADYSAAEKVWQDVLKIAENAEPDEVKKYIPVIASNLADCLETAGELERARRVAQQAWDRCRNLPTVGKASWLGMFYTVGLDLHDFAQVILSTYPADAGPEEQASILCVKNWVDDPATIIANWSDWMHGRIAAGQLDMLKSHTFEMTIGLWSRDWQTTYKLLEVVWAIIEEAGAAEVIDRNRFWGNLQYPAWAAISARDFTAAEEIALRIKQKCTLEGADWLMVRIATLRGEPTPPEVIQMVEQKEEDRYNMINWYVVAREAAAAGDKAKAFSALRKALSFWCNSPRAYFPEWESDTYWGELRNHPEFKRAFDEKKRYIGPIYGHLHYFPGW